MVEKLHQYIDMCFWDKTFDQLLFISSVDILLWMLLCLVVLFCFRQKIKERVILLLLVEVYCFFFIIKWLKSLSVFCLNGLDLPANWNFLFHNNTENNRCFIEVNTQRSVCAMSITNKSFKLKMLTLNSIKVFLCLLLLAALQ